MSIFDNKNVIEITKDDINDASLSSKCIEDNRQKRAFANVLGARLGIKFLHSIDIKADKVVDREITYNEYLGIE